MFQSATIVRSEKPKLSEYSLDFQATIGFLRRLMNRYALLQMKRAMQICKTERRVEMTDRTWLAICEGRGIAKFRCS